MPTRLELFLNGNPNGQTDREKAGRIVVESGKPYTMISLDAKKTKYFLDEDDFPTFYKLYCEDLRNGTAHHFNERCTPIGILRVDLDFKYAGEVAEHKHTADQTIAFVNAYMKEASRYVEMPPNVQVFVLEKDYPTHDKTKNVSASGIHIQVPGVKTRSGVEQAIRRNLLSKMDDFFPNLGFTGTWEQVYDKQPLTHTNHWPMLGSKKLESLPYQVKYVLEWDDKVGAGYMDAPAMITPDLVRKLSVRSGADEETPLTDFGRENVNTEIITERDIAPGIRATTTRHRNTPPGTLSPGRVFIQPLTEPMLKYYEAHVKNLHVEKRCLPYEEWIRVGQCLKNIHHELQDVWLDFSAQCGEKFNAREAISKWNSFSFRSDGPKLGIGSLRHWSREDNEAQFKEIEKNNTDRLVEQSAVSKTEHDVAEVVHSMYRDEFKCVKFGGNVWYQFAGHIWHETDKGVNLLMRLSSEVARLYLNKEEVELHNLQMLGDCPHKEPEPAECPTCKAQERKKNFSKMYNMLRTVKFKDNVLRECRELFLDESMLNKLDETKHLIAFANGVFDCQKLEFRDGHPDDCISFSTQLEYNPAIHYSEHKCWPELDKFLCSVLSLPDVREYFLDHLASCLCGGNKEQKFHILTGVGSNGKSMLMNLMCTTMGDYACKAPVSLVTQKRGKSGAAAPELVRMKGRRFITMQEPDEEVTLNLGCIKDLSSSEKISARDLYAGSKQMLEFEIQAPMHLACNDKPRVISTDGGSWRRLLVVAFLSKFVNHPKAPNELPRDDSIMWKTTSEEWATCFLSFLVDRYKTRRGLRNLEPPAPVLAYTNEYQVESDVVARFLTEMIVPVTDPTEQVEPVLWGQISSAFVDWKKQEQLDKGSVQELKKKVVEMTGQKQSRDGWTTIKLNV